MRRCRNGLVRRLYLPVGFADAGGYAPVRCHRPGDEQHLPGCLASRVITGSDVRNSTFDRIPRLSARCPGALPGVTPADARARARALTERAWFPDTLGVIGVLLVTALLAWHRLWLENGLAYLDVATFYMPWYAHLGEAVRALDIPGWNPYVFSGTPFAGDPQSGWWYFPAMAIFSLFEPVRAYQIFLIFHLAFAGVTTYILCRMYGLQVIPSLAAGAAYQSGPFVSHVSCCLIHVQLATWIPMALIGVETTVRGETSQPARDRLGDHRLLR